jgi:hypothetical protein
MLHHWGGHCLTYLNWIGIWQTGLRRSTIPIRIDGSQSEKVVSAYQKLEEIAASLWEP